MAFRTQLVKYLQEATITINHTDPYRYTENSSVIFM